MLSHPAARVALVYSGVALLWILLSDFALETLIGDHDLQHTLGLVKGALFVLITGTALYTVLRRRFDSLREQQHAAQGSEERFRTLASSLDDIVYTVDLDQRLTMLLGPLTDPADVPHLLGKRIDELFEGGTGVPYSRLYERVFGGERLILNWSLANAAPLFHVREGVDEIRLTISPLRDTAGAIIGAVGVGRDMTPMRALERQREEAEERASYLVQFDPLTGLPNRALMEIRLAEALATSDGQVAVHLVDVDAFRDVNDSLGRALGDHVLQEVARRLREVLSEEHTVARLSADEFVVIQTGMKHSDDAAPLAEVILGAFALPIAAATGDLFITASVGVAVHPSDGEDPLALLRAAETAMRQAKQREGTTFEFFHEEMAHAARRRLGMANDLRRALDADEMDVAFQPIVRTDTSVVVAFEALARWERADGWVSPVEFIPAAERLGLVGRVDQAVRQKAFRWMLEAAARGHSDWILHLNLSAHTLSTEVVHQLAAEARDAGVDPGRVLIEVTESAFLDTGGDVIVQALQDIRAAGFGLAVDDFGTGYSSLTYLSQMPLTALKIDRSFLADLDDRRKLAIVDTTIALGRRLGYEVIVEGVETEAQREYVERVAPHGWQGFLFSRGVTGDEALALLDGAAQPPA